MFKHAQRIHRKRIGLKTQLKLMPSEKAFSEVCRKRNHINRIYVIGIGSDLILAYVIWKQNFLDQ